MANRIDTTMQRLKSTGKTALVPFVTVGFPDLDTSEALARTILESGGDIDLNGVNGKRLQEMLIKRASAAIEDMNLAEFL